MKREPSTSRRAFLAAVAAAGTAGCSGLSRSGGETPTAQDSLSTPESATSKTATQPVTDPATTTQTTATATETDTPTSEQRTATDTDSPTDAESSTETTGQTDTATFTGGDSATLSGQNSWPMFQFGAKNTGYSPVTNGPKKTPQEVWKFETSAAGNQPRATTPSTPIISNKSAYIRKSDETIYALNAENGEEKWSQSISSREEDVNYGFSAPAVVNGTVYAYNNRGEVHALNARNGEMIWQQSMRRITGSSPTVVDGTVYASAGSKVSAFAASDGTKQWGGSQSYSGGIDATPAVVNDTVFVGGGNALDVFAASDGTRKEWGFSEIAQEYSSVCISEESLYITDNSKLYSLSLEDGEKQWESGLGNSNMNGSLTVSEETIYSGYELVAFNADDGREKWSNKDIDMCNPVVAGDTVYAVERDPGILYALNPEDGGEKWKYDIGSEVYAAPSVVDGVVFVSGIDGSVRAISG